MEMVKIQVMGKVVNSMSLMKMEDRDLRFLKIRSNNCSCRLHGIVADSFYILEPDDRFKKRFLGQCQIPHVHFCSVGGLPAWISG